jgi:site-specific DNA-methyltransferase (adenine-specific)
MIVQTKNYILYNGDALEILPTLKGLDCCVTDPPYLLTSGGATEGGLHERIGGGYDNGGNMFDDCPDWSDFVPLIYDCLRNDAQCYLMADSKNQFEMQAVARAAGFYFHNLLYWDKGICTPNRWYMKNAEYVGFFSKGKCFKINNCGSKQGIYIPHIDECSHPTEKPVLLMRHYVENSTQQGETVIDPFMGTGTTGLACLRSGRKFVGIEKDPRWFKVAAERLERESDAMQKQTLDLF